MSDMVTIMKEAISKVNRMKKEPKLFDQYAVRFFNYYDNNRKGYLSIMEYMKFLRCLYIAVTNQPTIDDDAIAKNFGLADTNKNRKIDIEEFKEELKKRLEDGRMGRIK